MYRTGIISLSLLALLAMALPATAQTKAFENPFEYFSFLNQEHGAILQRNMEYVQYAVHSEDVRQVEEKRLGLVAQIVQTLLKVGSVKPYDKDDAMHGEMLAVLKLYMESFELEFREVNVLKDKSVESYEAMARYLDAQAAAEKKLAQAAKRFQNAQRKFAKVHGIQLVEGDTNTEVDQLNQLNGYQRAIFLKQFGISKLDAAFWDALKAADVPAMERTRRQLADKSRSELGTLRNMPAFNGNTEYRDAVIRSVEFLSKMADNGYNELIQTEKNKAKDKLTQEDVDAYNAVITAYNNTLPANQAAVNEALNKLLRDNVPKPTLEVRPAQDIKKI